MQGEGNGGGWAVWPPLTGKCEPKEIKTNTECILLEPKSVLPPTSYPTRTVRGTHTKQQTRQLMPTAVPVLAQQQCRVKVETPSHRAPPPTIFLINAQRRSRNAAAAHVRPGTRSVAGARGLVSSSHTTSAYERRLGPRPQPRPHTATVGCTPAAAVGGRRQSH